MPNARWYNLGETLVLSPEDILLLENKGNQQHCRDPNNMKCCKGFPFRKMAGFGWDCVPAKGYENNHHEDRRTREEGYDQYFERPHNPADYGDSPPARSKHRTQNSSTHSEKKRVRGSSGDHENKSAPVTPVPEIVRDAVHEFINHR